MRVGEATLFGACRSLEAGDGARDSSDDALLALLEDDRAATAAALGAVRELVSGFEAGAALCSTQRTTLTELRAFELDLRQHVHEETAILFPRVRELLGSA